MATAHGEQPGMVAEAPGLHEVFSDFNVLETQADGRIRIPLGAESVAPDLQGLQDGQVVLILYPDELQAVGTVESELYNGMHFWYAVLPNRDAIQNIHPEAIAERERQSGVTR
jgi:hypothetical protein